MKIVFSTALNTLLFQTYTEYQLGLDSSFVLSSMYLYIVLSHKIKETTKE